MRTMTSPTDLRFPHITQNAVSDAHVGRRYSTLIHAYDFQVIDSYSDFRNRILLKSGKPCGNTTDICGNARLRVYRYQLVPIAYLASTRGSSLQFFDLVLGHRFHLFFTRDRLTLRQGLRKDRSSSFARLQGSKSKYEMEGTCNGIVKNCPARLKMSEATSGGPMKNPKKDGTLTVSVNLRICFVRLFFCFRVTVFFVMS